mmetsp:Transcript_5089/g.8293  ORF Transcript_5089/g.8293 Transcript_5089/m.8293 type:complete len:352 (+) Transcript_5089:253-1308(+)
MHKISFASCTTDNARCETTGADSDASVDVGCAAVQSAQHLQRHVDCVRRQHFDEHWRQAEHDARHGVGALLPHADERAAVMIGERLHHGDGVVQFGDVRGVVAQAGEAQRYHTHGAHVREPRALGTAQVTRHHRKHVAVQREANVVHDVEAPLQPCVELARFVADFDRFRRERVELAAQCTQVRGVTDDRSSRHARRVMANLHPVVLVEHDRTVVGARVRAHIGAGERRAGQQHVPQRVHAADKQRRGVAARHAEPHTQLVSRRCRPVAQHARQPYGTHHQRQRRLARFFAVKENEHAISGHVTHIAAEIIDNDRQKRFVKSGESFECQRLNHVENDVQKRTADRQTNSIF